MVAAGLSGTDIYVPNFEITASNTPIRPDVAKSILRVTVDNRLDSPGMFSFDVNDPELRFIDARQGLFAEGTEIAIRLGYMGQMEAMMMGEISALEPNFPDSGAPTLTVRGFDLLHRLTRGTFTRTFTNQSLRQISQQIAGEMGLGVQIDSVQGVDEPHEYMAQSNQSNLQFLQGKAEHLGLQVWVENSIMRVGQRTASSTQIPITLEWGKTLRSFQPRLTMAGQVNEVIVRGWDPVRAQQFTGRAQQNGAMTRELSATGQQQVSRGSGGTSQSVVSDRPISSQTEADMMAQAILADITDNLITGTGSSMGRTDIRAGVDVQLTRIGRFGGTYQVLKATHTLGSSGYQTTFEVRRRIL